MGNGGSGGRGAIAKIPRVIHDRAIVVRVTGVEPNRDTSGDVGLVDHEDANRLAEGAAKRRGIALSGPVD